MNKLNWVGFKRSKNALKYYCDVLTSRFRRRMLRNKALRSKDERYRLSVARQLEDESMLRQMALEASNASIRLEAADLIQTPVLLSAIALSTWDIELGKQVVARIDNLLILRRVASSARQDAIRLAAAQKLRIPRLMKKIALSTADISLRWEVARSLNDPELMADVALFKPGHSYLDPFRKQAQEALHAYLNDLEHKNVNALLSFILLQDHLPFKLQAFLHLPAEAIQASVLKNISRQEFSYIEQETIRLVMARIQAAGWSLDEVIRPVGCALCKGKGMLALQVVSVVQSRFESEVMVCPDCGGIGEVPCRIVACSRHDARWIRFTLPYRKPLLSTVNADIDLKERTGQDL